MGLMAGYSGATINLITLDLTVVRMTAELLL